MATTSKQAPRPKRARARRPKDAGHPSPAERMTFGKATRATVPRSSHALWEPPSARPDPIALLEEQASGRVPDLAPIRYGRMSASPFAFYRGAAAVMAGRPRHAPQTGLRVQLCGDAHLATSGCTPRRSARSSSTSTTSTRRCPGRSSGTSSASPPASSVAARDNGFGPPPARTSRRRARAYRSPAHRFAGMKNLDVWYASERREEHGRQPRRLTPGRRGITNGKRPSAGHGQQAPAKLPDGGTGARRIVPDPPSSARSETCLRISAPRHEPKMRRMRLADGYRIRCPATSVIWSALPVRGPRAQGRRRRLRRDALLLGVFTGRDADDLLFLQVKEARQSVLEPFGARAYKHQGERVVAGQRLTQAASDIFLGWLRVPDIDGESRDFYIRKPPDEKGSLDVTKLRASDLSAYGRLCADFRPCPRSLGRRDRNRGLPWILRRLRPGGGHVCRALRRSERA